MRKIIFGLTILFVASQLFVSCSSENEILSQFSKRKYLKKYKAKKGNVKNDINVLDVITDYQVPSDEIASSETESIDNTSTVVLKDESETLNQSLKESKRVVKAKKPTEVSDFVNDYSSKSQSNNEIEPYYISKESESIIKSKNLKKMNNSGTNEIVIGILCVFIPPLAVFLYEGSITNNFWFDLIATLLFWLPGMILAFLICFGGVSF